MTDEGVEPGPPSPPGSVPCVSSIPSESCVIVPGQVPFLVHPLPPPRTLGGFACVAVRSGGVDGEGQIHPPWQRARPPLGAQGSPAAGPQRSGCLHARGCGSGSQGPVLKAGFVTGVGVVFWGEHRGPRPHRTPRGVCWCGLPLVTLLGRVCTCRPGAVAARMGVARGDGHTHTTAGGQGQGRLPLSP